MTPETTPPEAGEVSRTGPPWSGLRRVYLGPRAAVRLVGPDAPRFCDNFVTAAVSGLSAGGGTEAFVTDAKGWVIAFVHVLRTEDGLIVDAAGEPALGGRLRDHLEHYHIREKVEIADVSNASAAVAIVGASAAETIAERIGAAIPRARLSHAAGRLGEIEVRAVRIDWTGEEGVMLIHAAEDRARLDAWLAAAGVRPMEDAAFEAARIERGYPTAADIPEKTLPQELGRDAEAISFTKGCYLGQETVARIDALGHVNRRLVGFAVEGPVPAAGSAVTVEGETVGRVGSACESPRLGMPLALSLVHVKAVAPDVAPMVGGRPARVVPLPVPPPEPPRTVLLKARRFRVVGLDERLADGSRRTREVIEHPGSVVILPLLDASAAEPEVCLVENHRVAVGRVLLELPAGTLDADEPLEETARRELAEETGYRATRLVPMGGFWASPGILRERMHLFRAEGLVAGEQSLEPGERIVVRVVAWREAVAMCLDGRIEDAKSIAAILIQHAHRMEHVRRMEQA